jgi:hypothetical protein
MGRKVVELCALGLVPHLIFFLRVTCVFFCFFSVVLLKAIVFFRMQSASGRRAFIAFSLVCLVYWNLLFIAIPNIVFCLPVMSINRPNPFGSFPASLPATANLSLED